MQGSTIQKAADMAGAVLSQLCLVHCLLLPLLLSVIPSLGSAGALGGEGFHLVALLFTTPVALWALRQGALRHGSTRPSALGLSALCVLWTVFFMEGSVAHDVVAAFNVTAGFLMAWAHWQNWHLTKDICRCSAAH